MTKDEAWGQYSCFLHIQNDCLNGEHPTYVQLISKPLPPCWFRECSCDRTKSARTFESWYSSFIDSVLFVLCPHCDHLFTQAGVTGGSHRELESFFGVFWYRSPLCSLYHPSHPCDHSKDGTVIRRHGCAIKDQNMKSLSRVHSGLIRDSEKKDTGSSKGAKLTLWARHFVWDISAPTCRRPNGTI